ncbi:MAG: hypothetical protein HKN58_10755 [Xanthomonadales bacterium]|nr:hypothetical protein [Xanthomonadales bacterium]
MSKQKLGLYAIVMMVAAGAVVAQEGLDEPLASRGDIAVTHREFDARMSVIPEKDQAPFLRDAKRLERVLSELLLQKQLAAEARSAGYDQEPLVGTRMELAANAELAKAWLEHYVSQQPDADYVGLARERYLLDPSKYQTRPSIDVSHILISTEEREVAEAEALALEVRQRLQDDPEAWDALVMTYSEDPSVTTNGGSFSGVERGDMVKNFENAAFAMEAGQISDPVRTAYGFHIIRLDGKNEPGQLEFEQVKARLVAEERRLHRERIRVDYLNQFGTVETDMTEEGVLKMLSRYRTVPEAAGQQENDSE